jgi:CRISPR/Cas system endoribonuclease Cas6 (RAMP superfamily)
MKENYFDHSTKAGIAGGSLLSIFLNIQYTQLFETAALAAVGAAASFGMTFFLKFLIRKWKK